MAALITIRAMLLAQLSRLPSDSPLRVSIDRQLAAVDRKLREVYCVEVAP